MIAAWSPEAIEALGPTTTVPVASSVFGISSGLGYELIRRNDWPTRVLRLGRTIKIPTHDLLALLYPERPVASGTGRTESVPTAPVSAGQMTGYRILNAVSERAESG